MPSRPTLDQFAAENIDDIDVAALDRLARIYGTVDPVPPGLVERIRFAITLDALEAEIADLQRADDLVGVRGDDQLETQTVTFTSPQVTTMVTITPLSPDRVRVDGWVVPGAGAEIRLRTVGDTRTESADADGRFVFDDVPRGPAQFVVQSVDSHRPVITPSLDL